MSRAIEQIYVVLLIIAVAFAGEYHGLSHATICERMVGTDTNVAYLQCELRSK